MAVFTLYDIFSNSSDIMRYCRQLVGLFIAPVLWVYLLDKYQIIQQVFKEKTFICLIDWRLNLSK